MIYESTRGMAPSASFEDALLAGLAPDGGLYMPVTWPTATPAFLASLKDAPYADCAAKIIGLFAGKTFSEARLLEMARQVYGDFTDARTAPLTQVGDEDYILELFHGPTLAFKDFAMQILGRMFDDVLARRDQRLTIIAATSGDTGAAAIDALKDCTRVNVVVLHPEGRVTDVQRRMMTTVDRPNVKNIAVQGSFDDCQAIVKKLFADTGFVEQVSLGGVNSINWARLAAQTVYYFTSCAALALPSGSVSFVAPTGNFGDIFAGYAAKKMGLNINRLIVATNTNDILHRAMTTGDYSPASVTPTASPSMDIQIASNFERLLFEIMDRDSTRLREKMQGFTATGSMTLTPDERKKIAVHFGSHAASEEETLNEIKRHYESIGDLIDPHTAVARCAAVKLRERGDLKGAVVTLSTAHPAKFPDAVEKACGVTPALPGSFASLFELDEHMTRSENSTEAVKSIILDGFAAARS